MTRTVVSAYFGHDAGLCARWGDDQFFILEAERLFGDRYFCLYDHRDTATAKFQTLFTELFKNVPLPIEPKFYLNIEDQQFKPILAWYGLKQAVPTGHHRAHAAGAFAQSPYQTALVMSFDGGGHNERCEAEFFTFWLADRNGLKLVDRLNINIGTPYLYFAFPAKEIRKHDDWDTKLMAYAGKVMGLAAYGKVHPEWVPSIRKFFVTFTTAGHGRFEPSDLDEISKAVGVELGMNTTEGQLSYDLAATAQHVFEELAWEYLDKARQLYPGLPVVLTGGCALNVLFNEKVRQALGPDHVFVPPTPNDSGLTFGFQCAHSMPKKQVNVTYAGLKILDKIPVHVPHRKTTVSEVAQLLADGKIIGWVQGRSEVGPRALGNRSILCYPTSKGLKDKLNKEIKFREWFRPLAPVVPYSRVPQYFDTKAESPFMSFAPRVLDQEMFPAITHEDGTARVQTVTEAQNPKLHDLLFAMEEQGHAPVLLNTSFNIKGKPLLSTVSEALHVLQETPLDAVVIENDIIFKPGK